MLLSFISYDIYFAKKFKYHLPPSMIEISVKSTETKVTQMFPLYTTLANQLYTAKNIVVFIWRFIQVNYIRGCSYATKNMLAILKSTFPLRIHSKILPHFPGLIWPQDNVFPLLPLSEWPQLAAQSLKRVFVIQFY